MTYRKIWRGKESMEKPEEKDKEIKEALHKLLLSGKGWNLFES